MVEYSQPPEFDAQNVLLQEAGDKIIHPKNLKYHKPAQQRSFSFSFHVSTTPFSSTISPRFLPSYPSPLPLPVCLRNIQPQPLRIKIQLILPPRLLQQLRNTPRILNAPQIYITPALFDGITDQFGGAGLALGAHDSGLFFLPGFVDDEGGALGFLLSDLFGFDCGSEFWGEGEVL